MKHAVFLCVCVSVKVTVKVKAQVLEARFKFKGKLQANIGTHPLILLQPRTTRVLATTHTAQAYREMWKGYAEASDGMPSHIMPACDT